MIDNALDLAHIDFTHDGTIGKRLQASCIRSEPIIPSPYLSINSEAFSFKITRHEQSLPFPQIEFSHFHFIPPCFLHFENHARKSGQVFIQIFIILPSAEKKMRLLLQFYRNFACYKWIEYIPGYDYLVAKFLQKVVNEDLPLLNGIHRNIEEMGTKPSGITVSADASVKAFGRYQSRVLEKYKSIYLKREMWTTTAKPSDEEIQEIDIEDLAMK